MGIRVALAQVNTTVGDVSGNANKVIQWSRRAVDEGADLVVFPELTLAGYPPEDLLLKDHFVSANEAALEHVLAETRDLPAAIVIGCVTRADGVTAGHGGPNILNSLVVAERGHVLAQYDKMLLPNYGVFDEKRYFVPGNAPVSVQVGDAVVALTVCEDVWYEDSPALAAAAAADLVVNISASPYCKGKGSERQGMLAARAREQGTDFALCALVGGQDELVFDGQSVVVDQDGKLVARGSQFEEDLVLFSIPREQEVPAQVAPVLGPTSEVYEALKLGVRDYAAKNGFERVVLGLSGGIDSALAACIAVDALGADKVTCLVMPSPYSNPDSQEDARRMAKRLGAQLMEIPISPAMEAYDKMLVQQFAGTVPGVAEENIQARIRGNLIMALSNKFGWLVLTTGNKSEMACGYCTVHGDILSGFAALKDIPKTLVYELSEHRNSQPDRPIPSGIIERPPSAELKPGQADEDSLPPYHALDPILEAYIEEDRGRDEIVAMGFDESVVEAVITMVDRAEYKRRQTPPGVKVTPKAFGRDRRLPITNHFPA